MKDYIWAFPVAGGVIALIAFLTPAGYLSSYYGTLNVWIWGLFSVNEYGYGSIVRFTQDPGEILVSIIGSLIILVSIGKLISSGRNLKSGIHDKSWAGPSAALIIGIIVWMVGMEINAQISVGISLWSNLSPGFGVIGMFLGGIIALVGYGVSKRMPTRQTSEVIIPMKKEFPLQDEAFDKAGEAPLFKFCPNCGYKIANPNNQFCTNCGFELKGLPMT
ncbi:MAG: zinc ribbon domain-containing protein [Promethearchaeota archaeon]